MKKKLDIIRIGAGIVEDAELITINDLNRVRGGVCSVHVECNKLKCIMNGPSGPPPK